MSPATILIADDYEDNRELLRLMLTAGGYRIREARNGHECVAEAIAERPDLILIDLSMPVLDGWGALEELRADERTRDIPCAALTAFPESDRARAMSAGFDAYLTKPYNGVELLAAVARLVEAGRARRARGTESAEGV